MKRSIVAATVLGLVAPLGVLSAPPANATSTGIEISMDESELIVVGHPSPTGASDSQVTGDIAIKVEGASFVVIVDEDSGGGAQLWSTDPSCNPATGSDVTRVTCAIPDPGDASVYIDLEGIDERGSGRLFAVVGDLFTTFLGSAYDDEFYAGDGGSYVEGGAGADSFFGGAGDDQVIGGPGPDTIDVSEDTAQDFVDCNDDASRGTNQSGDPMNEVEWDPRYDEVMDCGFPGSPRGLTRPVVETPFIGSPVGSNLGTWEGKGLRYFRTWYICPQEEASFYLLCPSTPEKEIAGAEKATYTPTPADEGKVLIAVVGAKNNFGYFQMASAPSEPITKAQGPANIYAPWFSETSPRETRKLNFNTGVWDAKKGDTFSYLLERCQTLQSGNLKCYKIQAGETQSNKVVSYTPSDDDVDLQLRVTVTGKRKVKAGQGYAVLETVAASWRTASVRALEQVEIPKTWSPRLDPKTERYSFTNASAIDAWLADTRKRFFSPALNVVRVGLPEIMSTKKYEGLRKYRQYLPMSDGAILDVTPGFGEKLKGYPGQDPAPQVTVVVYDKLRDLDSCAAAIEQNGWFTAMQSDTLQQAITWLTRTQCPNWKVEWSATESRFPYSWVERVRVDKAVNDGVTTSTIVVVARPPKLQSLFLTLQPMALDEATAYPDHLTLTWDGDLKAGARSSFRVWPTLAATGQLVFGGRYASIDLFDVDGRRLSSVEWNALNTGGSLQLDPIPMSAVFATPGTARVLVRVVDSGYQLHEVYADIPVRAASGSFATLDGRCWQAGGGAPRGVPVTSCPAPSAAVRAAADFFAKASPDYTKACSSGEDCTNPFVILQKATAYVGPTPAMSGASFSVSLANETFLVSGSQVRSDFQPRASCDWWNLVCIVSDFFTPKKARVAAKPVKKPQAPPPPAPPVVVEAPVPTLSVGGGSLVAGLTYDGGCTLVGADYGVGCGAAFNATKFPANSSELLNLDGGTLLNLDGGTLLNLDGGTLLNLDGGTLRQASPAVAFQNGAQLTVPVSPIIAAGGLN